MRPRVLTADHWLLQRFFSAQESWLPSIALPPKRVTEKQLRARMLEIMLMIVGLCLSLFCLALSIFSPGSVSTGPLCLNVFSVVLAIFYLFVRSRGQSFLEGWEAIDQSLQDSFDKLKSVCDFSGDTSKSDAPQSSSMECASQSPQTGRTTNAGDRKEIVVQKASAECPAGASSCTPGATKE